MRLPQLQRKINENFRLRTVKTNRLKKLNLLLPTLLIVAGFFTSFSACNSKSGNDSGSADTVGTEYAMFLLSPKQDSSINERKFEQVPAVAGSADGKVIYVAWYSGGAAPGPGNFVTVSTSIDNGSNWVNDQLVVYPKKPSIRIFDPALWRDQNGQMHLFYGSAKDSAVWDGFGGVNSLKIAMKGSNLSFSDPERLSDGVMSNKPVFIKSKNLSLYPIYIDKPAKDSVGVKYPANGAFILGREYSTGNMPSISQYSSIELPDSLRIHDEPQLVETSNKGNFLALLRTTKGIYFANSTDYGKLWTVPMPFTASGPTTSSRFYIGKLASGNLLLVANNSTTRNNMTAFLSTDGGKTWPKKLLLDARENVSYPDADQTSDGNIHVVFDRDRTGAKDILYCRFTEESILKGDASSVFKARVNKP